MQALTFSRFGSPDVLEWTALPDPQPAPGVAVVRTHAIGLNFADVYRRQGRYHLAGNPPWIAGYEAAGEIIALVAQYSLTNFFNNVFDPEKDFPPVTPAGSI